MTNDYLYINILVYVRRMIIYDRGAFYSSMFICGVVVTLSIQIAFEVFGRTIISIRISAIEIKCCCDTVLRDV